jgi:hypothetical protein
VGIDDGVEGVEPLAGDLGIDVRQLVTEPIEDHGEEATPRSRGRRRERQRAADM